MYINLLPTEGVGEDRGKFLIKEQWEKSMLSLGAKNSNGYLLHCCAQNALRKIGIHISLENEIQIKSVNALGG